MTVVRRTLASALLLAAAACGDGIGPRTDGLPSLVAAKGSGGTDVLHDLRQGRLAPSLTSYRLSFWAVKGQDRVANVGYSDGLPFLRFTVPAQGLSRRPDGTRFKPGDSVLIEVTIDPVKFRLRFEPSGLEFNSSVPATIDLWYGYADADLDGDGDADLADLALRDQLSFWMQQGDTDPWMRTPSSNESLLSWIRTQVPHFSGYAVSW